MNSAQVAVKLAGLSSSLNLLYEMLLLACFPVAVQFSDPQKNSGSKSPTKKLLNSVF
ncbi:MAG: hypothetical protein RMZ69_15765 [Nostoc sp. ChiQUE01a]|uniref:hypothetical protein n=1 Tax=Nostoc sp. CCY 9925 TaxID=3103865 RepID=UPI002AD82C7E|nr:hypothetical protein [Nostoc sp. ChiQUE01a]